MSWKVKLMHRDSDEVVLYLVAAGTALTLIAYVNPMLSLPETAEELSSGAGAQAWILSSMSVGLAAALLATGTIADAIGRRRVYVGGLALLGASSLLVGLSNSSALFVAGRVLAGVGGAAILAAGLALIAASFPPGPRRSRATGVWGASVALGISAGVVLAAALGEVTGWRATYLATAALSALLVVPSLRLIPESSSDNVRGIDVPGTTLLSASITLVVTGLTQARSGIGLEVVVLLSLALAAAVAFAFVERQAPAPLLAPELLRSPAFLIATVGSLSVGGGIIGMASNVPTVVLVGLGDSMWHASILVLVWSVSSIITSLALRRVQRPLTGAGLIGGGLAVVALGQLLGLGLQADSPAWRLVPAFLVAGLATGVLNAALGREAVASVPPAQAAMGSGANNTARYLGAACGITAFSLVTGHAGTGSAQTALVEGWNVAVLVSTAITATGALLVGIIVFGERRRRARGSGPLEDEVPA